MLRLKRVEVAEKDDLYNLLQKYLAELSIFVEIEKNSDGEYYYKYFDDYWRDKQRIPYYLVNNNRAVGFVFLRLEVDKGVNSIAEFYVLEEYRGLGYGTQLIRFIFEAHPAKFEIIYNNANISAKNFWNKVSREFSQVDYEIQELNGYRTRLLVDVN